MSPQDSPSSEWFHQHVLPHEPMLRAWVKSQYPDEKDVDDVVQEAMVRVLRAREKEEITSPKAFLFTTARNLVLSNLRKATGRNLLFMADLDVLGVYSAENNVSDDLSHAEELEILTRAVEMLPSRCRKVITLRKIYGMSARDIARELGISVRSVERQVKVALLKLEDCFEQLERGAG